MGAAARRCPMRLVLGRLEVVGEWSERVIFMGGSEGEIRLLLGLGQMLSNRVGDSIVSFPEADPHSILRGNGVVSCVSLSSIFPSG